MSKRLVGAVDEYDGDRFFTKLGGNGKTVATPLLLCLVCIELSDFVFAVDSIPAVLGVSKVKRTPRLQGGRTWYSTVSRERIRLDSTGLALLIPWQKTVR